LYVDDGDSALYQQKRRSVLERIPLTFREQYFSLFAGPEPETLHPDLYQKLIDHGTDLILERFKNYNKDRKDLLKTVCGKIKIEQAKRDEGLAKARMVASDAGNNGVDLRSAFAPLYASTAIVVEGWEILDEPICRAGEPDIWPDEFDAKDREAMLTSKIQFEVTKEAVVKWKPKFVVLDGTLLLHYGLIPTSGSSKDYVENFKSAIKSAVALFSLCYKNNIPIVGFVKRTRMNHICNKFGMPHLRDTALLDLILRLGQYTLPETDPMKGLVVSYYKKQARRIGLPMEDVKNMTNFYSSYIRTGLTTPFRLEMPKYCLNKLHELVTILFTTSEEDGIPFAINEADHITKITTSLSNIRTLMLYSKALDLVKKGEMDPEDLNLLALQHGEMWVLKDEGYWSNVLTQGET